ncbi:MAG: hypothetical protein INR71_04980 [Terriglobus roseus]|nr:hypothetical protein [Terriglobus roseus]
MPSPPLSPLPDFCTMCGQEIFCETCGNPTDSGCFLEVEDPDEAMTDAPHTGGTVYAAQMYFDDNYDDLDDLDDDDDMDDEPEPQPEQRPGGTT